MLECFFLLSIEFLRLSRYFLPDLAPFCILIFGSRLIIIFLHIMANGYLNSVKSDIVRPKLFVLIRLLYKLFLIDSVIMPLGNMLSISLL